MKILLLVSGFNGLSQRAHRELQLMGHNVLVEFSTNRDVMLEVVKQYKPDMIICPFIKQRIPNSIWKKYICLVIHPGIEGDRGPSSLDWAISNNKTEWGVTLLQAAEEMDAGDIWATQNYQLRTASKTSIYNREVTQNAIQLIKFAVENVNNKKFRPRPLNYSNKSVKGTLLPLMKQEDRKIDWENDSTDFIIRKINAADGSPGVLDEILGKPTFFYNVKREPNLSGKPGDIIARCDDGICKATRDAAVWIKIAKRKYDDGRPALKLPSPTVFDEINSEQRRKVSIQNVPTQICEDIYWYIENSVAYVYFDFYNGAMNTSQCRRLKNAIHSLKKSSIKVIVLMGGENFWSNGIHLNCIEAAKDPAGESWKNIHAIDNLVEEIIHSPKHITIAALRNNAGAGGAIMPLACDRVAIRDGVVLNPHYGNMCLYGSEYWTYLLPKRVGETQSQTIMQECQPLLASEALSINYADDLLNEDWDIYTQEIKAYAEQLTQATLHSTLLDQKRKRRQADEKQKRLSRYRKEELIYMRKSFFDLNSAYHHARQQFVYKVQDSSVSINLTQGQKSHKLASIN